MISKTWNILLEEMNGEGGDVIVVSDGEIIGTWSTDESEGFYQFKPNNAKEPVLGASSVGIFCERIWEFHLNPDWIKTREDHL